MNRSQLIRQSIPEYDNMHPTQQELLEKYFNYRVLFDLDDRIQMKLANIERLQRQDIASVRTTTPGGNKKHVCKFGHACFRKNPEHSRDFLHYTDVTKRRVERYMREIELLKAHQQHHLNKHDNYTQKHNIVKDQIDAAKQLADFVLMQYQTLETDRFMRLLQLLSEFEQPINPELDSQEYGLECPGFAIIMTWIINIDDSRYGDTNLATLFSLLDQIPVSGSYNKERIQKEMSEVYKAYIDNIYPEQGRYIRDDPLISNNTMADYLDKLSEDSSNTNFEKTTYTVKRRRMTPLAGIMRKASRARKKSKKKHTKKHTKKHKKKHTKKHTKKHRKKT